MIGYFFVFQFLVLACNGSILVADVRGLGQLLSLHLAGSHCSHFICLTSPPIGSDGLTKRYNPMQMDHLFPRF